MLEQDSSKNFLAAYKIIQETLNEARDLAKYSSFTHENTKSFPCTLLCDALVVRLPASMVIHTKKLFHTVHLEFIYGFIIQKYEECRGKFNFLRLYQSRHYGGTPRLLWHPWCLTFGAFVDLMSSFVVYKNSFLSMSTRIKY